MPIVNAHFKEHMIPLSPQAEGTGEINENTSNTKLTCLPGAPLNSKAPVTLFSLPVFKWRKKIQVSWCLKTFGHPQLLLV